MYLFLEAISLKKRDQRTLPSLLLDFILNRLNYIFVGGGGLGEVILFWGCRASMKNSLQPYLHLYFL